MIALCNAYVTMLQVQMGETLAYAFSNGPYGEQELSVSSTNQCSTCDDYWTPQRGKKNRSIHPETSMLFEKNCSKINAASDCLFGAAVSHNLELASMDVDGEFKISLQLV